jgi:hypothetical protein
MYLTKIFQKMADIFNPARTPGRKPPIEAEIPSGPGGCLAGELAEQVEGIKAVVGDVSSLAGSDYEGATLLTIGLSLAINQIGFNGVLDQLIGSAAGNTDTEDGYPSLTKRVVTLDGKLDQLLAGGGSGASPTLEAKIDEIKSLIGDFGTPGAPVTLFDLIRADYEMLASNIGPMMSERFSTIVNLLSNLQDRVIGLELRASQILGQFDPVNSMLDVIENKVDEIRVELLP